MRSHKLSFCLILFLGLCLCFPTATAKPALAGSWELVFDEEFDGNGILPNSARWNIVDAASTINNELEYYTPSSMWLWDSQLNIKSEQRQMGGRHYTSGMIVSVPKFKYGKFEIRGRLPRGKGIWPAYWLLQHECGGYYGCPTWPPEIDILEMLGDNTSRVYASYHYGTSYHARWPNNASVTQPVDLAFDSAAAFHTYTVEWWPDRITWFLDGTQIYNITESTCGYARCIADEEMSIIINTAVGGNWPGNPDNTTQFPQYHFVDYVKVYQWDAGTPTETPTATNTNPTETPTATPTATSTATHTPIPPRPDTVGVYKDGWFYLRHSNGINDAHLVVPFGGNPSDLPVVGDWNDDGIDTVGVYRNSSGHFLLSNSNTAPAANHIFLFGNPGDIPFSGRWTADMTGDGVGVYRNSNGILYHKKALNTGFSDYFAIYGNPDDKGFAGDWNGDGFDSIGIYRPSDQTWYLSNNSTPAGITFGDLSFVQNIDSSVPVIGDWQGDGHSTIGYVSAAGIVALHPSNSPGFPYQFAFGPSSSKPVAGRWNLSSSPPLSAIIVANAGNAGSGSINADNVGAGD